ncbi:GNAT family N-acetyltransferase [Streptosporangiaceae bacterium NEAU-GS5]|nr:GNAT family N-acetyltransferase [Streptosporangiaceae bacterium NEAU-GS5]
MTAKMPGPVVLENSVVRLEPLSPGHVPNLFAAGRDDEVWQHLPTHVPRGEADVATWVSAQIAKPTCVPFAVIYAGRAIGSTSYHDVGGWDDSIEIGSTWYGRAYWRTAVNTACKVLLLDHAFDTLGMVRVVLKTDIRNLRSQAAIERIGGVREGVLRRQYRRKDGTWRDSAYYSILDDEWPAHRTRLMR